MKRPFSFQKRGQAIVLLFAILVAFVAFILWILAIRGNVIWRLRSQDGGDAAALAAARWQAAGLNLIGELNLMQAYLLTLDPSATEAAENLHLLRLRLQVTTPFLALAAANLVAERNNLDELDDAQELLKAYADALLPDGLYPGAELDQQYLLELLASEKLYVFPLSPLFNVKDGFNLLLEQDFYEAILGQDWCWFWFNAYAFLRHYSSYTDFGPVPEMSTDPFFSLHLAETSTSLETLLQNNSDLKTTLNTQLSELGHPELPEVSDTGEALEPATTAVRWSIYDPAYWGDWEQMKELPIDGTVRDQYDVEGTAIALSVDLNGTSWIATAKPFGTLNGDKVTSGELVLGGFTDVRLIPVSSTDVGIRGFDAVWIRHLRTHVQTYAESGITSSSSCRYCKALRLWGSSAFRGTIINWLRLYGDTCRQPSSGSGGSSSGGASYGH